MAIQAAPVSAPRFLLEAPDNWLLRIDPTTPAFRSLGVSHVLYHGARVAPFEEYMGFERLGSVDNVYRVLGGGGVTPP